MRREEFSNLDNRLGGYPDIVLEDENTDEYKLKQRKAGKTTMWFSKSIEEAEMFLMQMGLKPDPLRKASPNSHANPKKRKKKNVDAA